MKIQASLPDRLQPALQYIPLAGIWLLALVLRLWDLGARSLWMDEAYEYWSAIPNLNTLRETVLTSFQPPLYTFLLHFWLQVSDSPAWMRLLSVLFNLLALAAVLWLAQRHLGVWGGAAAGLLVAVAPPEVRYAQEAAEYALLGCLLAWGLLALDSAMTHNRWRAWFGWAVAASLAVYSHYGAAILVCTTALVALVENIWRREWSRVRRQAAAGVVGLISGLPLISFLLQQLSAQEPGRAAADLGTAIGEVGFFLNGLGDTFSFYLSGWPFTIIPRWLGLLPVIAILSGSLVLLGQRNTPRGVRRLLAWFWVSTVLYLALVRSGLYGYGGFGFRYMLVLAPLFVLAAAAGLLALMQRLGRLPAGVLLAGVLVICLLSLPNRSLSERLRGRMNWPEVEDLGRVMRIWQEAGGVETPTYIYSSASLAFRYYARQMGIEAPTPLPATWYADCGEDGSLPYCRSGQMVHGAWTRDLSPEEKRASLEASFGEQPRRFWVIFSHIHPGEDQQFLQALSTDYRIQRSVERTNAAGYLLVRK